MFFYHIDGRTLDEDEYFYHITNLNWAMKKLGYFTGEKITR